MLGIVVVICIGILYGIIRKIFKGKDHNFSDISIDILQGTVMGLLCYVTFLVVGTDYNIEYETLSQKEIIPLKDRDGKETELYIGTRTENQHTRYFYKTKDKKRMESVRTNDVEILEDSKEKPTIKRLGKKKSKMDLWIPRTLFEERYQIIVPKGTITTNFKVEKEVEN